MNKKRSLIISILASSFHTYMFGLLFIRMGIWNIFVTMFIIMECIYMTFIGYFIFHFNKVPSKRLRSIFEEIPKKPIETNVWNIDRDTMICYTKMFDVFYFLNFSDIPTKRSKQLFKNTGRAMREFITDGLEWISEPITDDAVRHETRLLRCIL